MDTLLSVVALLVGVFGGIGGLHIGHKMRHLGVLVSGLICLGAAITAYFMRSWWPFPVAFALLWLDRLLIGEPVQWQHRRIRTGDGNADRLLKKGFLWPHPMARLFACDCAEHVLHLFLAKYPEDETLLAGIGVARQYAKGKVPLQQLEAMRSVVNEVAKQTNSTFGARMAHASPDAMEYDAAVKAAIAVLYAMWIESASSDFAARTIETAQPWTRAWMAAGAPSWAALAATSAEVAASSAAVGPAWMHRRTTRDLADDAAAVVERHWQTSRLIPYPPSEFVARLSDRVQETWKEETAANASIPSELHITDELGLRKRTVFFVLYNWQLRVAQFFGEEVKDQLSLVVLSDAEASLGLPTYDFEQEYPEYAQLFCRLQGQWQKRLDAGDEHAVAELLTFC